MVRFVRERGEECPRLPLRYDIATDAASEITDDAVHDVAGVRLDLDRRFASQLMPFGSPRTDG